MKATDIFSQRIIAHNCDLDDSLQKEVFDRLAVHNDVLPFNYERLYNSGRLRALLKDPKSVKWVDVQFREQKEGGKYDGLDLMKGADFILPLVFLHNALIARLEKDAKETPVTIWPGIRGDVVIDILENWEADGYIEDIKAIYNLHFDLTRKYYKNHVERMSEEDCKKLLAAIEELDFSVAILQ